MSRKQVWKVIGLTLLVCGLQLSGAQGVTFTPFVDITNSVYIQPQAINPAGVITGWYYFADFRFHHGFVRALDGTITTFDLGSDTQPQAINPAGTITGFYTDQFGSIQGFVRASNGNVTTLKFSSNVQAFGITPAGATTGTYLNSSVFSGFILSPGATLPTSFDAPSMNPPVTVTAANGINPAGAITGYYIDQFGTHCFLRTPGGSFTTFDPQGSGVFTRVNQPMAINPAGAITGFYQDLNVNTHGFIRASNGNLTTIDGLNLPMAFSTTHALAINPAGTIVGDYTDVNGTLHGFILPPGATIPTALDVPNTGPFTGATGTAARAINPTGVITGYYFDANNIGHGFLRLP